MAEEERRKEVLQGGEMGEADSNCSTPEEEWHDSLAEPPATDEEEEMEEEQTETQPPGPYPDYLLCMQTKELLKDPVVCEDGYSYEAKVVKKAGRKYHINHLLKEIIEELKSEKDLKHLEDLLRCPLSKDIFKNPYVDEDGRTCDYIPLLSQKEEKRVSIDLFPNRAILGIVEEYRSQKEQEDHMGSEIWPIGKGEPGHKGACVTVNFHVLVPVKCIQDGVRIKIVQCSNEKCWGYCEEERNSTAIFYGLRQMGLTIKLFTSPKVKKPLYIRYEYIGHAPKNVKLQDKDRLKVLEFDKNIDVYDTVLFMKEYQFSRDSNTSEQIRIKCFNVYMTWMFKKMLDDDMKCIEICNTASMICDQMGRIRLYHTSKITNPVPGIKEHPMKTIFLIYSKEWIENYKRIISECQPEKKKKAAYTALCIMNLLISKPKQKPGKNDKFFEFFKFLFKELMIEKSKDSALVNLMGTSSLYNCKRKGSKAFKELFQHFFACYETYKIEPIEHLNFVAYLHFLDHDLKPYACFDIVVYRELKKTTVTKERVKYCDPDDIKAIMQSGLLEADPYLVFEIFYTARSDIYPNLFRELPPLLTMTWLHEYGLTKYAVTNKIGLRQWAEKLNEAIKKTNFSDEELSSMKIYADGIFSKSFEHVNLTSQFQLRPYLQLCLNVMSKQDNAEEAKTFKMMDKILSEKFEHAFLSRFGGGKGAFKEELRVWENIWITETRLEKLFTEKYLQPLLIKRVSSARNERKIELLHMYGGDSEGPKSVIANEASKCVFELISKDDWDDAWTKLEKSEISDKYFRKPMHTMCAKHVEETEDNITLHDLLEWRFWPRFLKYCKPSTDSEDDSYYKRVMTILEEVCNLFQDGNIPIKTLEKLQNKESSFECLLTESSLDKVYLSAYKEQCRAYGAYTEHRKILSNVLFFLKKLMAESLNQALMIDVSESDKVVRDVSLACDSESGYKFPLLQEFESLSSPVLTQMKSLLIDHENDVFMKVFGREIGEASRQLSLSEIVTDIWTPVYERCIVICKQIKDLSMELEDVKYYFARYSSSTELKNNITALLLGVNAKSRLNPNEQECISKVVKHVGYYKEISKYGNAAEAILNIKEEYNLTGDFEAIFKIRNITAQQQPRLRDIEESMVEAGKDLKSAAPQDIHLKILQSITKHSAILKWIKQIAKDSNDLKGFVNLALETGAGGEDSLTKGIMINLRDVGTSFASFIFELEPSADHHELLSKCEQIWATVDTERTLHPLLAILKSCNEDLDRYKQIKKIHGNVEATSFGQLKSILTCGQCTIGTSDHVMYQDISDYIKVVLKKEEGKRLPKERYNYTELEDLESRLVLISGRDKKKEGVDTYLRFLDILRRISKYLITLQQAGCEAYIGWKLTFDIEFMTECDDLVNITTNMERELRIWNKEIESARSDFYYLNYFTTNQMLSLRKNLKTFKENFECADDTTEVHTLNLLRSICPELTLDLVKECLSSKESSGSETESNECYKKQESGSALDEGPEPDLQDLSEEQEEMYNDLIDYYKCPSKVSRDAVKRFDKIDDAVDWIDENMNNEEYQEEDFLYIGKSATANNKEGDIPDISEEEVQSPSSLVPSFKILSYDKEKFLIERTESSRDDYLTLDELGSLLKNLASHKCIQSYLLSKKRPFSSSDLKVSAPNLIVTSEDNIFKTILSIYAEDKSLPPPTFEEVLICNQSTTLEQVDLFWQKSVCDPEFKHIFCLVHAQRLSYQVVDKGLQNLFSLIRGKRGYRLVIICGNEDESRSHIVSRMHLYRRAYARAEDSVLKKYLKLHLEQNQHNYPISKRGCIYASSVLEESSSVCVVHSKRPGMGKSLYVKRLSEKMSKRSSMKSHEVLCTIPIHGPDVTSDYVMSLLVKYLSKSQSKIFSICISPSVNAVVSDVIFSLAVLKGLSNSKGNVWRVHPSQLYCFEITLNLAKSDDAPATKSLIDLLPQIECVEPSRIMLTTSRLGNKRIGIDNTEFRSAKYQRVYQYLKRGDAEDAGEIMDKFVYKHSIEDEPEDCLSTVMRFSGVKYPTWRELCNFIEFLNLQLYIAEQSVHLKGASIPGLKAFIVKFLIRMSKDFATSSLQGEVDAEEGKDMTSDALKQLEIVPRHRWEKRPHPYIFFNQDLTSATFVGFSICEETGDLINPGENEVMERAAVPAKLIPILSGRLKMFDEGYRDWDREKLLTKLSDFMGVQTKDFDPSYTLTIDNFIKILGIQMRFRCGIPVILMGETGCGKTRLIRFMCELMKSKYSKESDDPPSNLFILKVHGGTTEEMIIKTLRLAQEHSETNRKKGLDTILFFDEANTTEAIGLIKEIVCDRTVLGIAIPENIKFVAACNPYKRHADGMIKKLQSAGLGFFVKDMEKQQKIGKYPLWQLVYRVIELPPAMRPLVYDFGQLTVKTERDYTKKIVENHIEKRFKADEVKMVAEILTASQYYMRSREDECSFVSLRDVERAMILFKFFMSKHKILKDKIEEKAGKKLKKIKPITRSLILSLCVCYHSRLQSRSEYEEKIVQHFQKPLELCGGVEQFRNEIQWCEDVILDNMEVPKNIAKNEALRENVFMMTMCIENRIPLFIVGKPGSSKSLAKTIVSSSMNGKTSSKELMKEFKEVHMFSYQCSKYSTPESIVDVFKTAKEFQRLETNTRVSVVVLDEVGLAEDSPSLPLKALHPLLEDGAEGGDGKDQIIEREKRVAFIGISNWALDPAKMNRGVMVTRTNPGTNELVNTARGICWGIDKDHETGEVFRRRLERYLEPLAKSYEKICDKYQEVCNKDRSSKKEFYGLRDFYSLIKMLLWLCTKSGKINSCQLEHVVKRNFGGTEEIDPWEIFKKELGVLPTSSTADEERNPYNSPDNSPQGLIRACVSNKSDDAREDRYLLFLTENYTALQTLQHFLYESDGVSKEPYILFGSSFPRDKEYTQTCRNINKIKLCMEEGCMVILLNLENLYESLYDVLNQYYLIHGDKKYVDLGLQSHRMKCHVHSDFRLILIAESRTVYDKFPTPLINRLEKHFILSKTLLKDWQLEILKDFKSWISDFVTVTPNFTGNEHSDDMNFKPEDAFVGYQEDTPAAIILQASREAVEMPDIIDKLSKIVPPGSPGCATNVVKTDFHGEITKSCPSQPNEHQRVQFSQAIHFEELKEKILGWIKSHPFPEPNKTMPLEELTVLLKKCQDLTVEADDYYNTVFEDTSNTLLSVQDEHFAKKTLTDMRIYLVSQWILYIKKAIKNMKDLHWILRAKKILTRCKNLLLKTATPDAVLRVKYTRLFQENEECLEYEDLQTNYFITQCHKTLDKLLKCLLEEKEHSKASLFLQVTTFGHLLSEERCKILQESLSSSKVSKMDFNFANLLLQEFDTEEDFISKTSESIQDNGQCNVVVVQCEAGHTSGDLIACARYRINDILKKQAEENETTDSVTHVLFIIQLPRKPESSTFVGFQGDPWVCYHLDELILSDHDNIPLDSPADLRISKLFYDGPFKSDIDASSSEESFGQNTNQCSRLYNCIQAAAAKLSDDDDRSRYIERITILGQLLAKEKLMECPLDDTTFCGSVVKYILKYLHRTEQLEEAEQKGEPGDWIFREAMDSKSLQHGGTFRNCLGKRIEEKLTPLLAEIIAFVDMNYNLNLLSPSAENSLGMKIFQHPDITKFKLLGEIKQQLPGVGGLKSTQTFQNSVAFSWIIIDVVTSIFHKCTIESGSADIFEKMLCQLSAHPIGPIIAELSNHCLVKPYIHDYVRSVYVCTRTKELVEKEYELIELALHSLCNKFLHGREGEISLTSWLVCIHIVYDKYETHFLWFGETVSFFPGILVKLHATKEEIKTHSEMIHLYALHLALGSMWNNLEAALKPDAKKSKSSPTIIKKDITTGSKVSSWLHKMRNLQTAVNACLSIHISEESKDPRNESLRQHLQKKWQQLHVIQILVEQVISKDENNLLPFARRMLVPMKKAESDLTTETTFNKVVQLLENMCKFLQKTFVKKKSILQNLQEGVALFFVEMTTDLCFTTKLPEPKVIYKLIGIAIKHNEPSGDLPMHMVPGFHMFLLHKLLILDTEVTESLEFKYLENLLQEMMSTYPNKAGVLCLQYTNYCESTIEIDRQPNQKIFDKFRETLEDLGKHSMNQEINMKLLKCVARTRWFMSYLCSLLNRAITQQVMDDQDFILTAFAILQKETNCTAKSVINKPCCLYLVRLIARKYGFGLWYSIRKKFRNEAIKSVIPYIEENYQIDPMMVYDKDHTLIIEAVDQVLYDENKSKLDELAINSEQLILFLLILYEKFITFNVSSNDKKTEMFMEFIENQEIIKSKQPQIKYLAELVIKCKLPNEMMINEEEEFQIRRKVSLVIIHTIAVFSSFKEGSFFDVFIKLMNSPLSVADMFVPAMPEGNIYDLSLNLFECISCSSVVFKDLDMVTSCNSCGNDLTPVDLLGKLRGYNLQLPKGRSNIPSCERTLPASSCQIIRIFLHALLYWSCSTSEETSQQVAKMLKIEEKRQVASIFWKQLLHDMKLLSLAVGHNMDETCLILHMVLKKILNESQKNVKYFDLSSNGSRQDWEITFHSSYVESLFCKLDSSLQDVIERSDKYKLGHDRVYQAVFDVSKASEILWQYVPQLTLERLSQFMTFGHSDTDTKIPTILKMFIKLEPILRATQHLPAIVALQRRLYDKFNECKLDSKIQNLTFESFIKEEEDQACAEYKEFYEALHTAWNLCKEKLTIYARNINQDMNFDEKTCMKYLIPTASNEGSCTIILVKYLLFVHNTFILKCNQEMTKREKEMILSLNTGVQKEKVSHIESTQDIEAESYLKRRPRSLHLSRIQKCHLLDYQRDLIPIILLHSQLNGQKNVIGNIFALETHIMHTFIDGKPLITEDIPVVVYTDDDSSLIRAKIGLLREKIPQKELSLQSQQDILKQLGSTHLVHQCFEQVCIVVKLASSGGPPTLSLQRFIQNLDMKSEGFSSKALECSNLENLVCLWRILGNQLAQCYVKTDHEPFEVKKEYRQSYDPKKDDFNKVVAAIDRGRLLSTLYEYIEIMIMSSSCGPNDSLVDSLSKYISKQGLPTVERFKEDFPKDIYVGQAVEVWKNIADHEEV